MTYITSVERIGIRKGIEQGIQQAHQQSLQRERLLLLRLAGKRFGPGIAERGTALLERIGDHQTLDDLGEALIDSPDGEAWLKVLSAAAG